MRRSAPPSCALQSALDEAETAVDTFTDAVEAAFADAAEFVDGLNLDQVAGQIADGINGFSATIAKADMTPYFNTATRRDRRRRGRWS